MNTTKYTVKYTINEERGLGTARREVIQIPKNLKPLLLIEH